MSHRKTYYNEIFLLLSNHERINYRIKYVTIIQIRRFSQLKILIKINRTLHAFFKLQCNSVSPPDLIVQPYSILRPRFHFNSTWFQSILERRFVYSLQRSLITYPIWRLISYFLFLTEHKPGGEKERNCGSTCRYTRQGALFEARGREQ